MRSPTLLVNVTTAVKVSFYMLSWLGSLSLYFRCSVTSGSFQSVHRGTSDGVGEQRGCVRWTGAANTRTGLTGYMCGQHLRTEWVSDFLPVCLLCLILLVLSVSLSCPLRPLWILQNHLQLKMFTFKLQLMRRLACWNLSVLRSSLLIHPES